MGHGLCKNCYAKQRYYTDGGVTKAKMQEYTSRHPEMRAAIWRKHAYGLSEAEWFARYEAQNGCCAICFKAEPINVLNVDHCHTTLQVRGLLCGHCNKAIGLMRDRADLLHRAAQYLKATPMPKKKDPRTVALSYFATAPIEIAEDDLTIVRGIVDARKRAAPKAAGTTEGKPARRKATTALPGPQTTVGE
jgi:hypothetical protein